MVDGSAGDGIGDCDYFAFVYVSSASRNKENLLDVLTMAKKTTNNSHECLHRDIMNVLINVVDSAAVMLLQIQ